MLPSTPELNRDSWHGQGSTGLFDIFIRQWCSLIDWCRKPYLALIVVWRMGMFWCKADVDNWKMQLCVPLSYRLLQQLQQLLGLKGAKQNCHLVRCDDCPAMLVKPCCNLLLVLIFLKSIQKCPLIPNLLHNAYKTSWVVCMSYWWIYEHQYVLIRVAKDHWGWEWFSLHAEDWRMEYSVCLLF